MREATVQHHSGKKSPPCAIQDSGAFHRPGSNQVRSAQAAQPVNGCKQDAPNKHAPVKEDRCPWQRSPPPPCGVLDFVLLNRRDGTLVVLLPDRQSPTMFQMFDHALNTLTQ